MDHDEFFEFSPNSQVIRIACRFVWAVNIEISQNSKYSVLEGRNSKAEESLLLGVESHEQVKTD